MRTTKGVDNVVLVGVLKSKNDRRILFRDHWYRIPVDFLPKRKFTYLAFYQPAIFGRYGKRIEYYARVTGSEIKRRIDLLPREPTHPKARDEYMKFILAKITKLPRPVKNVIPRRVSFGFTTLRALSKSRDILELYGVPKTEQIIAKRLARLGIKTYQEYTVSVSGKRYRIDLFVRCWNGTIAIECDNDKAHTSKIQKKKDKLKDIFLKKLGWRVLRFKEKEIIEKTDECAARVLRTVHSLGGLL